MEITGTIILIGETQTFGNNGFEKRELVIQTHDQYPQSILVEFVQGKVVELDKFATGQDVTVSINLRGREWVNPQGETKYFNSLQGWKIKPQGDAPQQPQKNTEPENDEGKDDLPF